MLKNKIFVAVISLLIAAGAFFFYYQHIYLPNKFATLTEKILNKAIAELDDDAIAGQLIHLAIPGTRLSNTNRHVVERIKPGGIIFFGFNLETAQQIQNFTADLQYLAAELKLPPLLISTDQEGGYVKRVREQVLQTPPAWDLGATGDQELCRATGYHVSRDLGSLGINVFFAPVLDINNNPQNPVIGLRSFGSELKTVLGCALPFEAGARAAWHEGGALPVIKHFPGHGDTHTDSHWALPVIDKKLDELRSLELEPFRAAIHSGAQAVMTAHILYPQVDAKHPATLSEKWLNGILRQELQFSGLVFTDAMEMNAVSENFRLLKRPVIAVLAGADILLYTSWQEDPAEAKSLLLAAIRSGELKTGFDAAGNPSPLTRALKNQLRVKLPQLKIERFLSAEESLWYRDYSTRKRQSAERALIRFSKADLEKRFAQIRWSKKKNRTGPIWLAGRKNRSRKP